jgi:hypothetical protein
MQHYLVANRRKYVKDLILASEEPTSVKEVAQHCYDLRQSEPALKSVSNDWTKAYEVVRKDVLKLRHEGDVPRNSIVFPSRGMSKQ